MFHLIAQQIVHGGRAAFVGNVQPFSICLLPEQFGGQVVGRAVARAGKAHFAWVGAQFRQHVLHVARGFTRRGDQNIGRLDGPGDVVEILQRVILQVFVQVRHWACPACGAVHDRDVNAAINLKHLAVSSTVSACGEEGAGLGRKTQVKPASAKQEVSSKSV